mmetsp:Transcript_122890/g.352959  ORF Transcript_122890/g.352959 Transcript_122890/m.352959 type:complete len:315 (+) Transcript_122890:784-1728(+)
MLQARHGLQGLGLLPRHGPAVLRKKRELGPVQELVHAWPAPRRQERDLVLQGHRPAQLRQFPQGLPVVVLLLGDPDAGLRARLGAGAVREAGGYFRLRRLLALVRRRRRHRRHRQEHPVSRRADHEVRRQHRGQHGALRARLAGLDLGQHLARPHLHPEGRPGCRDDRRPRPQPLAALRRPEDVHHQLPPRRHDLRCAGGVLLPCDPRVELSEERVPGAQQLGRGQVHDALHGLVGREQGARHPHLGGQPLLGLELRQPRCGRLPPLQGCGILDAMLEPGRSSTGRACRGSDHPQVSERLVARRRGLLAPWRPG